jgi:enediyne biosynthesis protein E7
VSVAGARVPPGPEAHLSVQDVQRDPLRFLMELTGTYGDVVRYHADAWTVVLLNRPAHIKRVLQDNHPNYVKRGTPDIMMLKPMLGEGLLTSDGEVWYRQRRMTQPSFHRERIEAFGTLMTDLTRLMLNGWRQTYLTTGEAFEATEEMTRLTTRIVARSLFGVDLQSAVGSFGGAVQAMNEYMGNFDPMDRSRYLRFLAAHRSIEAVVDQIIDRKHEHDEGGDFLSMLLQARDADTGEGLSDRELRDQVMTLLMAGHETTAKALTWTFYLLDRNPEVRERLETEVAAALDGRVPTVGDLPRLPYTWMVLQEAMRLYPPVWIISRTAIEDDEVGGYRISKGSLVLVSPYAMHRHPDHWPEPEAFRPERFAPEAAAAREPFSHFPFSGGPRQCIGKSFATVEMQLVLASVVQAFRLKVVPGHPVEPEALVTLRPRHGVQVTIHENGR